MNQFYFICCFRIEDIRTTLISFVAKHPVDLAEWSVIQLQNWKVVYTEWSPHLNISFICAFFSLSLAMVTTDKKNSIFLDFIKRVGTKQTQKYQSIQGCLYRFWHGGAWLPNCKAVEKVRPAIPCKPGNSLDQSETAISFNIHRIPVRWQHL